LAPRTLPGIVRSGAGMGHGPRLAPAGASGRQFSGAPRGGSPRFGGPPGGRFLALSAAASCDSGASGRQFSGALRGGFLRFRGLREAVSGPLAEKLPVL